MAFLSTTILLFLVIDPIGDIPVFLTALRNVPQERRFQVVLRECIIGFAVLMLFALFGQFFLKMLRLSIPALGISGGIVLFLIALKMIFPTSDRIFGDVDAGSEPLVFPLAIPTVAGPSALATVMLLVSRDPTKLWVDVGALAVAMAATTAILVSADRIFALIGRRVMTAAERLMGLILTAVAIEMLLQGIRAFMRG